MSDHPTPIRLKTHVADPSPFAVLSSLRWKIRAGGSLSERVQPKGRAISFLRGIGSWKLSSATGERLLKKTPVKIRAIYADTDAMGIVYHTNYIRWFEIGRTELFRDMGILYAEVETAGFNLPLTQVYLSLSSSGALR